MNLSHGIVKDQKQVYSGPCSGNAEPEAEALNIVSEIDRHPSRLPGWSLHWSIDRRYYRSRAWKTQLPSETKSKREAT